MKKYIKSAAVAPYANIEKKPLTPEQKEMKRKGSKNNRELAYDMLEQLSPSKKVQLDKFLSRNEALTSTYGCSFGNLRVYKEGFYLTLEGTRSQFSVWYTDNDGELVEGRKPNESKLNFLYEEDLRFNGVDWYQMTKGVEDVNSTTDTQADWPDSNWWLSINRLGDPDVDDILADPEEVVLKDLGAYITVYQDTLYIEDSRGNVLAEMDEEQYTDKELYIASTCRGVKEFEGKYRNWIESLI